MKSTIKTILKDDSVIYYDYLRHLSGELPKNELFLKVKNHDFSYETQGDENALWEGRSKELALSNAIAKMPHGSARTELLRAMSDSHEHALFVERHSNTAFTTKETIDHLKTKSTRLGYLLRGGDITRLDRLIARITETWGPLTGALKGIRGHIRTKYHSDNEWKATRKRTKVEKPVYRRLMNFVDGFCPSDIPVLKCIEEVSVNFKDDVSVLDIKYHNGIMTVSDNSFSLSVKVVL